MRWRSSRERSAPHRRARYAEDLDLEGQLHARSFAHRSRTRGCWRSIRAPSRPAASSSPLTTCGTSAGYGVQIEDETVLALGRVRYVGDVVAAVAAETPRGGGGGGRARPGRLRGAAGRARCARRGRARRAARARRDRASAPADGGVLRDAAAAGNERLPPLPAPARRRRRRVGASGRRRRGDVPDARRTARARWSRTPALARWHGGRLEVFTGTQTPFNLREELAARLRARRRRSASSCRRWAARSAQRRSCARRRSQPRSRGRQAGRSSSSCRAPRSGRRSTGTRRS